MSNKNFQPEENEILSRDDAQIRQMLGALERVDAPKDFDFRLKARIASAKPQDFAAPRLFPILRYVAPLALAIVVLAAVVINGLYSVDNNSVATVIETFDKPAIENTSLPDNLQPPEMTPQTVQNAENLTANVVNKEKKVLMPFSEDLELAANNKKPKIDKPKSANNGGSVDSAVGKPNVLMPQGFGTNNSIPVKDVLTIMGIEASFSDKKWKVESVAANSMAGNAGVKANDIIESIDGNNLSGEMIPATKTFNGKLTVARGGERIELRLQNK